MERESKYLRLFGDSARKPNSYVSLITLAQSLVLIAHVIAFGKEQRWRVSTVGEAFAVH